MSETPEDPGFDAAGRENAEADPDTNLILDYLANKLGPDEVGRLEDRARRDKDFRYKLADLVLLKGLVMLALEKNPQSTNRDCRRTQRMFLDYLKGTTTPANTAELSRHLEECFECELAFERFQAHPEAALKPPLASSGWRRLIHPSRSVAITAVVAVVLAAGAIGVVGFLSSASASPPPPPRSGLPGAVAEAGLIRDPAEVREALAQVTAADASSEASVRLAELVDLILNEPDPWVRRKAYERLGKEPGTATRLLFVLAKNEPFEKARAAAYRALGPALTSDPAELLAATRREIDARSEQVFILISGLSRCPQPEVSAYLRRSFAEEKDESAWWTQVRYSIYCAGRNDPVIAESMKSALSDRNELMRSFAALAASAKNDQAALPAALGLLDSSDATVRENAAVAISRLGFESDVAKLFDRAWARDAKILQMIEPYLTRRGLSPPSNF
jgi:HEAT repeats/Putative zinc-finger